MLLLANIVAVALPPIKVVSQSIQAPPSTPHEGAANIRVASLLKLRRRILQLRLKIQHPPHAGSEAFVQMEKIVTNITSTWRRLFHEDVTHSIPPADQQVLPLLKHAESALTTEQEQLQHQRINTFKEYLTKDWNDTRKATYTWLRNREPFVPPCFKASSNNEFVTRHQQLHAMMLDDWRPIFNRYVERNPPDFQAFLATFPHCLPDNFQYSDTHPLHLTDIALTDVKHIIKEL